MRYIQLYISVFLAITATASSALAAEDVFELGTLTVSAQPLNEPSPATSVVSAEELYKFNKNSLDEAMALIPGVSAANGGGRRNERAIYVRGFDRFQVPLSIDGIRVYLPADNRLDFARFITSDLSEIQVSKGYVSVLSGPGALGGAVNLVTRKPVKEYEATLQTGLTFDGRGANNGYTTYGSAGTKQDLFYFQMSAAKNQRDHFRLSDDFTPTVNEDGGRRANSQTEDWRINAKLAFTPNATDEYTLNFTKQSGSKDAPYHTTDGIGAQRYWSWPYWDIQNIYFLSNTQIGDASYVKARVYYNTFENLLASYDDPQKTAQTRPYAFNSYYDDYAYGGSLELGTTLIPRNTLKGALHYRRDNHTEAQQSFAPVPSMEPDQTSVEDTWSLALENTFHATKSVDITFGISEDWRDLRQAEDYAGSAYIYYPIEDDRAFNWQGAVAWRFSETGKLHADVSSRTRFPNLFERFSTQFGGATSNPGLDAERSLNTQLGWSDVVLGNTEAAATVFYSDVQDMIQSVPITVPVGGVPTATTQRQNVGDGEYYGIELSATTTPTDTLEIGGNYTWLHSSLTDPVNPAVEPLDRPEHKLFLYTTWEAVDRLSLTPSVELADSRWTVTTAGTAYYQTGAYTLVNFQMNYRLTETVDISAGARNVFDRNYQLVDGFPEEGRSFFTTLRATF